MNEQSYITTESDLFRMDNVRTLNAGLPDDVFAMFQTIFSWDKSMRELNELLLSFLDARATSEDGIDMIRAFVKEMITLPLSDIHPSLMQATLLMTSQIEGIEEERKLIEKRMLEVLPSHQ